MENSNELNIRQDEVSVGEWIITSIIIAIPLVGFIMLFVWAFGGGDVKPSKRNYAKAMLLLIAICIGIGIVLLIIFGAVLFRLMS